MTTKKIVWVASVIIAFLAAGYLLFAETSPVTRAQRDLDPTPQNVTLSGTYVCLPHKDATGPQTAECAFGLRGDDGQYYAVNFGQNEDAYQQFRSGEHITAEGNVVIREALSSDHWAKYEMVGIFTITRMISPSPNPAPVLSGKIDIDAVCRRALAYMEFTDSASALVFVEECKEGKHPEVIERYKAEMDLGNGAEI